MWSIFTFAILLLLFHSYWKTCVVTTTCNTSNCHEKGSLQRCCSGCRSCNNCNSCNSIVIATVLSKRYAIAAIQMHATDCDEIAMDAADKTLAAFIQKKLVYKILDLVSSFSNLNAITLFAKLWKLLKIWQFRITTTPPVRATELQLHGSSPPFDNLLFAVALGGAPRGQRQHCSTVWGVNVCIEKQTSPSRTSCSSQQCWIKFAMHDYYQHTTSRTNG